MNELYLSTQEVPGMLCISSIWTPSSPILYYNCYTMIVLEKRNYKQDAQFCQALKFKTQTWTRRHQLFNRLVSEVKCIFQEPSNMQSLNLQSSKCCFNPTHPNLFCANIEELKVKVTFLAVP